MLENAEAHVKFLVLLNKKIIQSHMPVLKGYKDKNELKNTYT